MGEGGGKCLVKQARKKSTKDMCQAMIGSFGKQVTFLFTFVPLIAEFSLDEQGNVLAFWTLVQA